jgi:hypothetical protein
MSRVASLSRRKRRKPTSVERNHLTRGPPVVVPSRLNSGLDRSWFGSDPSGAMKLIAAGANPQAQPLLVRYRRVGLGMDQRLVVFEDGGAELDERHRTRASTSLTIDPKDLGRLWVALQEVPDRRWSIRPALTISRMRVAARWVFDFREDPGTLFFQMKRGRRSISGVAGERTDLAAIVLLDSLMIQAIGLAEAVKPTH